MSERFFCSPMLLLFSEPEPLIIEKEVEKLVEVCAKRKANLRLRLG